jgi:c-di-AMP phosphodiesterase-like protein
MANNRRTQQSRSPLGGFMPILILAAVFFVGYLVVKSIFSLIYFLAIPIFIITMILAFIWDKTVITNYLKNLMGRFSTNPLMAILQSAFTVVGFPFVSSYLAFKAFMKKKLREFTGQSNQPASKEDSYTDYEEVEEENEDFLELEPLDDPKPQAEPLKDSNSSGNEYEDLFD